ncbi:hypothetical protein [Jannaschia sp. 2305UL9-9]|uniref:hypothetical protein n=1 Tax=Jannaschia sp. 2305UL9-9 TaxID=3121638 RepID=UPI00352718DA
MADRHRSSDHTRETDKFIEDMPETPDHQGRSGGQVARDVGTQDALKRASQQGVAGVTRVRKSDERDDSDEGDA